MGKTLAYKILENHLISGDLIPGEEIMLPEKACSILFFPACCMH